MQPQQIVQPQPTFAPSTPVGPVLAPAQGLIAPQMAYTPPVPVYAPQQAFAPQLPSVAPQPQQPPQAPVPSYVSEFEQYMRDIQ